MIIYKTTNLVNGKIYVGKHNDHRKGYLGSGTILKQAIRKYGRGNFKRETLEYVTEDTWEEREVYWIKKLDAQNPDVGYNISIGGDGAASGENHPYWGKPRTEDFKKKLSKIMSGRKQSKEHIEKLSKIRKGKKRTKESIEKMIEKMKKKVSINGIIFDSVGTAQDNAVKMFSISGRTLYRRLRSSKFPTYKYI